jgi:hypothetical protein
VSCRAQITWLHGPRPVSTAALIVTPMAWADAEKLDDVACRAADQGRRVVGVPCYVSERANLELIVEQAMSEFGRVTSSSTTPAGRCPDRSWTRA